MPDPTLVLLHGQPDSSASFWALRRALRERLDARIRIAVPDRPGYGANPLPATDFRGNVRWLRGWLERFAPGPVFVLGHSWAGGVAALLAAEDLPTLAGLILLASIGPGCVLPIDRVLAAPVLGELAAFGTLGVGRRPVSHHAATVLSRHIGEVDAPFAWASGAAMRHRPLWRSFLIEQRALLGQLGDIDRALPSIRTPTLVVTGDEDPFIPARTPRALSERIAPAELLTIRGGHDLQLRQPAAVADAVAGFVGPLAAEAAR